jgi:hypothetical protein
VCKRATTLSNKGMKLTKLGDPAVGDGASQLIPGVRRTKRWLDGGWMEGR